MSLRTLDALFAEKVAWPGAKVDCSPLGHWTVTHPDGSLSHLPEFSESLDATWAVVAWRNGVGSVFVSVQWDCIGGSTADVAGKRQVTVNDKSAALALVLATLRAADVEEEEIQKAREAK